MNEKYYKQISLHISRYTFQIKYLILFFFKKKFFLFKKKLTNLYKSLIIGVIYRLSHGRV